MKQIVMLLEPSLCLGCRFASLASVQLGDGTERKMFGCTRGDCDNWGTFTEETVQGVRIEGKDHATDDG